MTNKQRTKQASKTYKKAAKTHGIKGPKWDLKKLKPDQVFSMNSYWTVKGINPDNMVCVT